MFGGPALKRDDVATFLETYLARDLQPHSKLQNGLNGLNLVMTTLTFLVAIWLMIRACRALLNQTTFSTLTFNKTITPQKQTRPRWKMFEATDYVVPCPPEKHTRVRKTANTNQPI